MTDARTEALTALTANGQSIIDGETYQIHIPSPWYISWYIPVSMCVVMVFGLTGDIPSRLSTELADCLWSFIDSCRNVSAPVLHIPFAWIIPCVARKPSNGLGLRWRELLTSRPRGWQWEQTPNRDSTRTWTSTLRRCPRACLWHFL